MIISGHQPNYLPYIGFFHKASLCDKFVIVDNVQYVKRGPFGWINRNKIRTSEGWQWLTVPVLSKGKYTQNITDTMIDNSKPWQHQHWRAISLAYQKAPYFKEHKEFFRKIYETRWEKLPELSEAIIKYLVNALGIKAEFTRSSSIGAQGKGTDLIIDMCKRIGADAYIHGKHGKDYIDPDKFTDNNIKCIYQEFRHPVYKQVYEPFIEELSVIDLLFNCGPESLNILNGKPFGS
ncbi:MAG: WbqC family protein [Planctomycetes bacterium]|nr:WbqC family protein [Planctomycetota bacterium]